VGRPHAGTDLAKSMQVLLKFLCKKPEVDKMLFQNISVTNTHKISELKGIVSRDVGRGKALEW
jgi:hypothetical protein